MTDREIVDRRRLGQGVAALAVWARASSVAASAPAAYDGFGQPRDVDIKGYGGDAMEPFLTRDGGLLLFNNSNDPRVNTDLHFAERIDDHTFQWRGPIAGVNTAALEGVPSMDRDGRLYFVSTRSYDRTASTLYRARFHDGRAQDVELVPGVSRGRPGWVQFDAEISADGAHFYLGEGWFGRAGRPHSARIVMASREGAGFVIRPVDIRAFAAVNASGLNYAPCTSTDELELFFTRAVASIRPRIWRASRTSKDQPFEAPRQVVAIDGFVEGPTISSDGARLYYHERRGDRYVIRCVAR